MPEPSDALPRPTWRQRLIEVAGRLPLDLTRLLPYAARVRFMGWLGRNLLGPVAMNRRTRANLRRIWPDLPRSEVRRLCRASADAFGRTVIELNSGTDFARHAARQPITGPGLAALEAAQARGQPVILMSAHFGNYDVVRAGLTARGFRVGGLYKPLNNPRLNARYVARIGRIAQPLFPAGRAGLAQMVQFLKSGGMLGILNDQHEGTGVLLPFLGHPALTALSAAKLALKYDALLVPVYAIRAPDGLNFTVEVEEPIPPSDPETMTRAYNDSVSARIRAHPGQWFWAHRRWKGT